MYALIYIFMLQNQTWVRSPPRAVKPTYWHQVVVKESAMFISGRQTRSPGQLALKTPELLHGFQERIFKGQVREGSHRVCDQLLHNSLIGWWWGNRVRSQGDILGSSGPGGLCVDGHQVVNIYHLVGILTSVKQLRKCASGTVIWILERGVKADDMGEGSVPGRSHRVLHGYIYLCIHTHTYVERGTW